MAQKSLREAVEAFCIAFEEGCVTKKRRDHEQTIEAFKDLRAALDAPDAEAALEELVGLVGVTVMNDSSGPVLHINFDWGDPVSEWIWITNYPNLAKWLKSRGAE